MSLDLGIKLQVLQLTLSSTCGCVLAIREGTRSTIRAITVRYRRLKEVQEVTLDAKLRPCSAGVDKAEKDSHESL